MSFKQIKTWEAACKKLGINTKKLPSVSQIPEEFRNWIINTYKIGIIIKALNTDEQGNTWEPDWNDSNQPKYNAWFGIKATKKNPAGVGFSRSDYDRWFSRTHVGSRLCFQSSDRVEHAQKYFKKIFIETHIIQSVTKKKGK